jgi:hypothetical protein
MIGWPSYNRSLVNLGDILFSYDFLDTWSCELELINKNKRGKPFTFPDSFILVIGYIRYSFHLPYRQTEGILKTTGKRLPDHPSYGHICKRINKLKIHLNNSKIDDGDDPIISVDNLGIKITNRGQWMYNKSGGVAKMRKGYLKIHVAVDINTKEILALEVTDEKVPDGKIMKKLVKHEDRSSKDKNTISFG